MCNYQMLVIYNIPRLAGASTIQEHVQAFTLSRFPLLMVNSEDGFPQELNRMEFEIIVLHYSLFGIWPYELNEDFLDFIDRSRAYKIAFFQDEYRYCRNRFDFLNRFKIDCVYTLLERENIQPVYGAHTSVGKFVCGLPGYVGHKLVQLARAFSKPDDARGIDIGYRGRRLYCYMGLGAIEKQYIGEEFKRRAEGRGLVLDIETEESKRIYGPAWHLFLAECRGTLGSESGVTIFDIDDRVRETCEVVTGLLPDIPLRELWRRYLHQFENNIYYRTISPRHFEAAAFRICQILFEGSYSHILEPMVHYIPLKKDFSNFEEVLDQFGDRNLRSILTANAYTDLILSGQYSYEKHIEKFDSELISEGFRPEARR